MMAAADINFDSWQKDALCVGVTIYSRVPDNRRPEWAASILTTCCARVSVVPKPITDVIELASEPAKWQLAHSAFSAVRELTLAADSRLIKNITNRLLYVAENAAKVIYNASRSSAPFDRDSGAWLVRCAKEFADSIDDVSFTALLWTVVTLIPCDQLMA